MVDTFFISRANCTNLVDMILGYYSSDFKNLGFFQSSFDESSYIPSRGTRRIIVRDQKEEGT